MTTLPFALITNSPCNNKGIDALGNETTEIESFIRFPNMREARNFVGQIGRSLRDISPVTFEYATAVVRNEDRWVPASGGTELPFNKDGKRWLRVFNPELREGGYLNLDTDLVYLDGAEGLGVVSL